MLKNCVPALVPTVDGRLEVPADPTSVALWPEPMFVRVTVTTPLLSFKMK
jgi:hypothetical protein